MHRDHLADDVIDLVDVFDDSTDPIFTDDVHHNELGARLVAEAIYANIADELHRIVREREGGR
jgi:lysophospholipase L1-like esterase